MDAMRRTESILQAHGTGSLTQIEEEVRRMAPEGRTAKAAMARERTEIITEIGERDGWLAGLIARVSMQYRMRKAIAAALETEKPKTSVVPATLKRVTV